MLKYLRVVLVWEDPVEGCEMLFNAERSEAQTPAGG